MGGRGSKAPSAIREAQQANSASAREASYAEIAGVKATINGETREFFFDKNNGVTYMSNAIGEIPNETPNNMTATELVERLKANGAEVQTISAKERSKRENDFYETRRRDNSDPSLGIGVPGSLRENARGRRLARILSRRR